MIFMLEKSWGGGGGGRSTFVCTFFKVCFYGKIGLIFKPVTVIKISNNNSAGQGLSIWTIRRGHAHIRLGLIAYIHKSLKNRPF